MNSTFTDYTACFPATPPRGLFARATLYRYKQEFTLFREDLEEAREIAYYGSMKLYCADYYLEACRNVKEGLGVRDEG